MEAVNKPLMLMDIERELAGPDREAALVRYDAILSRLDRRIDEAMKSGLPPDEFPNAELLKEANGIARKILRLTARVGGEARKA